MSWLQRLLLPRYEAHLVGLESGHRTPVKFIRFHSRKTGEQWCQRMNSTSYTTLTRWELAER